MTLELRPLGVACNLSCTYCYQDPQRDSGNFRQSYDLDRMKAALVQAGGDFILFGGEPLLLPIADLEELWRFGLERNGRNGIQTNGALITDKHMELFSKYKVDVGISIDGPGELNDLRWNGSVEKTRAATARTEAAIARLCQHGRPPGLIVTLHRHNASAERLPRLCEWMVRLDGLGLRSARLHLLEVDSPEVRQKHVLSPRANIEAMRTLAALQGQLKQLRFDMLSEMSRLLQGNDRRTSCVWHACDPYTTESVRGIEGNGQSSNCGRTNKDGIDFTKATESGYERYIALYHTPREHGGCKGCRFFLMCKGQCPGTAIDGDFRNRTEHCEVWMALFTELERQIVCDGQTPLTLLPMRRWLEGQLLAQWAQGKNPGLHALQRAAPPPQAFDRTARFCRASWVSDAAQALWQPRLLRVAALQAELGLLRAARGLCAAAVAPVLPAQLAALAQRAASAGVGVEEVAGPPPGDRSAPLVSWLREARWVLLSDAPARAAYHRQLADGDAPALWALLGVPACCREFQQRLRPDAEPLWEMAGAVAPHAGPVTAAAGPQGHLLLQRLGVRAVPHQPCCHGCAASAVVAAELATLGRNAGLHQEVGWLEEILAWSVSWTALHGLAEIKTPVLRLLTETEPTLKRRVLHVPGRSDITAAGRGLGFPYQPPQRLVQLRLAP